MAGDLFGGVFDNLRGYSSSIDSFFSRGQDTAPRTVGAAEEADLISSGWKSPAKKSIFSSAAADVSKTIASVYSSPQGTDDFSTNTRELGTPGAVDAKNTGATASVDPGDFERNWLTRLTQFAKLEAIANSSDTKAPKATKVSDL
jgi:hypothetical protein